MQVRFLVYSDIHHALTASKCLNLADTVTIEQEVHKRVVDGNFDFSVFCGDRFLKHEPEDEVKVKADRALLQMLYGRNIPHYHVVGNHDWTKRSREWHTSESIKYLGPGVKILDAPGTIETPKYLIHALPADVPFDKTNYQPNKSKFNLFLFHGIVRGSYMTDDGNNVFDGGIELSEIDLADWDFVVGGDIHVPQKIPFINTTGGYVGSVLQRTRADSDKPRGWLEVTAMWNGKKWDLESVFVPTRNFFHRETWEVNSQSVYEDIKVDESKVSNVAVEIHLKGARKDVDRVADDPRWKNYVTFLTARGIDVIRNYQTEQDAAVVDLSTSLGILDDLTLYLDSGFVDIGNLSREKIMDMVQRMRTLA